MVEAGTRWSGDGSLPVGPRGKAPVAGLGTKQNVNLVHNF